MSSKNYLGEELLLSLDLQNNYLCYELLLLLLLDVVVWSCGRVVVWSCGR